MNQEASLAIVVASCDKYSDLWNPLFGEFFKYWPDCPYPIFLVSNHKTYPDGRVETLLAGEDLDWSTTIINAIKKIEQSHVLFWIDDAFLAGKVENLKVEYCWEQMKELNANFMRLRPKPLPKDKINSLIGVLAPEAAYRVTLFATIWKKSSLNKILNNGESAWEFELKGTERARTMDSFYTVLTETFKYLHGVERGVWIRPTAKILIQNGYDLDFRYRRYMSPRDNFGFVYRRFKSWVLHQIPEKHRKNTIHKIQSLYKLFGLKSDG